MQKSSQTSLIRMKERLLGHVIVKKTGSSDELVPIYDTSRCLRFPHRKEYDLHRQKKSLVLTHEHTTSDELERVINVTADVEKMIDARLDDIRHQRATINELTIRACNEPESKTVAEELSICFGIVNMHLKTLKDEELLVRPIECTETTQRTTITLRPGVMVEIEELDVTIIWAPCRTVPDPAVVVTTRTTSTSSLVPLKITHRLRTVLCEALAMFDDDFYM